MLNPWKGELRGRRWYAVNMQNGKVRRLTRKKRARPGERAMVIREIYRRNGHSRS